MPSHVIRARPPRGDADVAPRITRDPDVLASFLEDAAHFPGGFAAGLAAPASEAEVAALRALDAGGSADRRAVVADRRRDAAGRSAPQHVAPQPDHRPRPRLCPRRGRRDAGRSRRGARAGGEALSAGADVHGRVRRRHRRRNAAGAATFKYGTTRDWVRALTVVLPGGDVLDVERGADDWPTATGSSTSCCQRSHGADPGAALPHARRSEAVGRLLRRAGDGPDRSVHRLRRHARRHHRGDAAGAAGAAGDVPGVRAVRRSRARRSRSCAGCATRRARRGAAATRAGSTCRPSSTWTRAAWRCCARTAPTARSGVTIPDGAAMALLVTLELPAGMTPARAFDDIGRAREPGAPDTPLVRFCRALDEAGVLDASRSRCRAIGRAHTSCWRCARRCRPASTRGSDARSSRSTRGSRRPRRT